MANGGVVFVDDILNPEWPGVIEGVGAFLKTNVLDRVILPVDKGANTQVYLAAAADTNGDRSKVGGLFFDRMRSVKPTEAASDPPPPSRRGMPFAAAEPFSWSVALLCR